MTVETVLNVSKFKMMKNLPYFLLFCFTSSILVSCSKDEFGADSIYGDLFRQQQSVLPDVFDVVDLITAPTRGYIYIKDFANFASQNNQSLADVGGLGFDEDKKGQDFGTLHVGDNISMECEVENGHYYGATSGPFPGSAALFGQEVAISLDGTSTAPGLNTTFKTPELLLIESPKYDNDLKIFPGLTIEWNRDPDNKNGIAILIHFNPISIDNRDEHGNARDAVETPIHITDSGSYTITSEDLKGIPSGAFVEFYIGRGNYKREQLNESENHFGIYSYTIVNHTFRR